VYRERRSIDHPRSFMALSYGRRANSVPKRLEGLRQLPLGHIGSLVFGGSQ